MSQSNRDSHLVRLTERCKSREICSKYGRIHLYIDQPNWLNIVAVAVIDDPSNPVMFAWLSFTPKSEAVSGPFGPMTRDEFTRLVKKIERFANPYACDWFTVWLEVDGKIVPGIIQNRRSKGVPALVSEINHGRRSWVNWACDKLRTIQTADPSDEHYKEMTRD